MRSGRGVVANLCRNRIRRLGRERLGLRGWGALWRDREQGTDVDVPLVVDVRGALRLVPYRRRACLVLRYAFDLSEQETARTLGISVGTVKSQTSRGAAQLAELLRARAEPDGAEPARPTPASGPGSGSGQDSYQATATARGTQVEVFGDCCPTH
ncbi:sigma factor-like helix-turn-helix DNA-binding protein [Streptacidiphilus sp. EB129]|uniref:sigma factor-like helix-turn-helix DNA-binding protein n=1 Tax=Streptacidiphilus sp. EB129 TaxID=3156262 RepID=UPI003515992D